jgi:hypothetical protein
VLQGELLGGRHSPRRPPSQAEMATPSSDRQITVLAGQKQQQQKQQQQQQQKQKQQQQQQAAGWRRQRLLTPRSTPRKPPGMGSSPVRP